MESKLKLVERNYVVKELLGSSDRLRFTSSSKMNPQSASKRSGFKQFMEEQKKILASKYPFLSSCQIQKRASALWAQLSREQKHSYSSGIRVKKNTKPVSEDGLKTLQSWLSSVRIESRPILPCTPQTTPKLPIYKRRPPTPRIHKLAYDFEENSSEEGDFGVKNEVSEEKESDSAQKNEIISDAKSTTDCQVVKPSAENLSHWMRTNNASPDFKVPLVDKKYKEGCMRSALCSSQNPPIAVENKKYTKGRGILLRQDNPKSKTFRVSFSDVTSMITFEKTPYEKEMSEAETDSDTGYTLRNRQKGNDAQNEALYSLRTRAVPESPNLTKSPRSPLISPLLSLPLRSPRRNRKKEEEEIRQHALQLSADKDRKWIPLLPTTPPIFVKLKGGSSQSQSPDINTDQSEPESPYTGSTEEQSHKRFFQVRPPTPYAPLRVEEPDVSATDEVLETAECEAPIEIRSSVIDVPDQEKEKTNQKSPDMDNDDLHLQLSPSESDESSLPDLAGYDKSGRVAKSKESKHQDANESQEENNEDKCEHFKFEKRWEETDGFGVTQPPAGKTQKDLNHYSGASEDSRDNEVCDASGYESDDSDIDKDRQLSVLHGGKQPCSGSPDNANLDITTQNGKTWENAVKAEREHCFNLHRTENIKMASPPSNIVDRDEITDPGNKLLKQKCITQYFERCAKSTSGGVHNQPHADSDKGVRNKETKVYKREEATAGKVKMTDSIDNLRKVSIAVKCEDANKTDTPRTPRTPRRLSFRLASNTCQTPQQEGYDKDSFFHTPQTRRRLPKNVRQTPSRTAPAFIHRRRSSRLQAKFAEREDKITSDSKAQKLVRAIKMDIDLDEGTSARKKGDTLKKKLQMNDIPDRTMGSETQKRRRGRPPKKGIGEVQSNCQQPEDKIKPEHGNQNQKEVISPIKFYGTRSKTAQGKSSGIYKNSIQIKNPSQEDMARKVHRTDVVNDRDKHSYGNTKMSQSVKVMGKVTETDKNTTCVKPKKRKSGKTARLSLCDIKTGTIDINVQKKKRTSQVKTDASNNMEDGWDLFGLNRYRSKPLVTPLNVIDSLDDFFGANDSSPDNDVTTMKSEGLETVERTVHSMREAAMSGTFTSPFNSSPKLSKLLRNFNDHHFCDTSEFSDVSSQRSVDDETANDKDQPEDKQPMVKRQQQASNENTEEVQTFLSDMFGELTPPDRPKKTLRRLCASGRGKEENNFTCMFDNQEGEDGIFM